MKRTKHGGHCHDAGALGTVHRRAPRRRHHGHPSGVHASSATIAMTSTELANRSYALAYLCTWTGSQWKCGCRDSACTQSYWQIQSFKR